MPKRTAVSSPSGKKHGKRFKSTTPDVHVPIDALGIVMQFLAPRELYRIAFTCKDMLKFITVKLVVRSALLHGGTPRKTVEALYPLMLNRSIHPVSALRMLQLCNCRRCEYCKRSPMRSIQPNYGVALCFKACLVGEEFTVRKRPYEYPVPLMAGHPRMTTGEEKRGWVYAWNRQLVQNGQVCGPLVTLHQVNAAMRSFTRAAEGIQMALQQLLQDAPPEEAYQEFVHTYQEFETAAVAAEEERQERLRQKAEEKKQKALDKIQKKIESVKDMINNPAWRFHWPEMNQLHHHVQSLCRGTEAQEIAEEINSYVDSIERSHFLSFSFLSEEDPFEIWLKQIVQTEYPDGQSFVGQHGVDKRVGELLDEGRYFDALVHRMSLGRKWDKCMLHHSEGIPESHEYLSRYVWHQVCEGHKSETNERKRLSRAYSSFQVEYSKCLATLTEYGTWLHSQDESINLGESEKKVLADPACFGHLQNKEFESLRVCTNNPAPGVGFRLDDLLQSPWN